jgi:hypothetical protein
MRVTLSASMPTAKPQQLDKPQLAQQPYPRKKAPIRELSSYIHYNRLTSPSTSSSVVAQEVAIRMTT